MAHTIEQIIELEPKIQYVLNKANSGYKKGFEDWTLYEACKREASTLVGFNANNSELSNSTDYNTVISEICNILHL